MLTDILNAFKLPKPSALRTDDAQLAMAALLVRLARADQDYSDDEKSLILTLLQSRYDLAKEQAKSLRAEAEALEEKGARYSTIYQAD